MYSSRLSSRAVAMLATAFLVLGMYGVAPSPVVAQDYNPAFDIHPDGDAVWMYGYPAFVTVNVTVYREGATIHSGTLTVDGEGKASYSIAEDVVPGDAITISDGTYTKQTTVTPIAMTGFDLGADVLSGTSTADTPFTLSVHDTSVVRHDVVGVDGSWSVNLAVSGDEPDETEICDVARGSFGAVWQADEDGDKTMIGWRVPSPKLDVLPAENNLNGADFMPGQPMTFTLNGNPLSTDPTTTNQNGGFRTHANADLAVGDVITASDGTFTKELMVASLAMTGVSGNVVSGTAETPTVHTWVEGIDGVARTVDVVDGAWQADFGVPGDQPHEQGIATLTPGMSGWMQARDDDGDTTQVRWRYASPHITASAAQDRDWIGGWDFPANTTVAITRNDSSIGELGSTDANGYFNFYGLEFDVADTIAVTVGGVTRETVLSTVAVTGVTGSVVSGVADTPEIQLWVHGAPDVLRHLIVSGGTWSTDLSQPGQAQGDKGTVDLAPGMSIAVFAPEGDGDGTQMNWQVRDPKFDIHYLTDWLWASDFTPSATLTVTVARGGTDVAVATASLDEDGNAGVNVPWDVQLGDVVTVTDGPTTKATIVTNLQVTDADAATDTVYGSAEPNSIVGGWVHNSPVNRENEPVDGAGAWTLHFGELSDDPADSGTADLVPGVSGAVRQRDADGDSTVVDWRVRGPSFNVNVAPANWIWAWDFRPGRTLDVTVSHSGTPDVHAAAVLDGDGHANVPVPTDLLPGDVVTVTDGLTTKTTTVTDMAIAAVHVDSDSVQGTAQPNSTVWLWVNGPMVNRNNEPVSESGTWAIDLSVPGGEPGEEAIYDIVPGSSGGAGQRDEDGDSTVVSWGVRNPAFNVHPEDDAIYGWNFAPGADLVLTRNGAPLEGALHWDEQGNFSFNSNEDIAVDDEISVSDGTDQKTTVVANLAILGVDENNNTIWGTADPDTLVGAWVWMTDFPGRDNEPVDENGDWQIDFSVAGDEDWEQATFDLVPGNHGAAGQRDADGDSTMVDWRIPAPAFNVHPAGKFIDGWDFAPNAPIYVTLGGTGIDDGTLQTDEVGSFWFDLSEAGIDVGPGDIIEVGDGNTAKVTTVTELLLSEADPDADTVSGTGLPDTVVSVWVNETGIGRDETIAGDGTWVADFAVPGDEVWEEVSSIELGWSGGAQQQDPDGDSTMFDWRVPAPAFNVHPDEDWIDGWDFPPNTPLYVLYGGSTVDGGSLTTDEWGNFWFSFEEIGIDVGPGDTIEVGDGADVVKDTTVTELALDSVDPGTDVVSGTAASGTTVGLWLDDQDFYRDAPVSDGAWAFNVSGPGDDEWEWATADIVLGSSGGVEQRDPDGDGTVVNWRIAAPAIDVSSDLDEIEGWDFAPNTDVQLRVNNQVVDTGLLTTDEEGSFWFNFRDIGTEINPSDLVEADDSTTVKSTVITDLLLGGLDPETDTVWGTATAGSSVNLRVWFEDYELSRGDPVAEDGTWLFNTTQPGDEEWEQDIGELTPGVGGDVFQRDEDGDSTKVNWHVPDPTISVQPVNEAVEGWDFTPNHSITVLVDGQQVDDGTLMADELGNFWLDLYESGIDIAAGSEVEVTDNATTKVTIVTALAVTAIDEENDLVIGTAAPESLVGTWCWDSEANRDNEWVDLSGDWVIDLANPGDDDWEWETYDIQPGSGGGVFQRDEDGDQTVVDWRVRHPQVQANLGDNVVSGWDFGGPVTVTITDNGTGDIWSGGEISYDGDWWELWLDPNAPGGWHLQPGQVVSVQGPDDTKVLMIGDLAIDAWDFAANTISGSTDQDFAIDLWIESVLWGPWVNVMPNAGTWTVSMDDAQPPHQLRVLDEVVAAQTDEDGDMTQVRTWLADQRFTVDLVTQQVFGLGWPEGSSVELQINGATVGTATAQTEGQNNMIPLDGTPNVYFELMPETGLVHPGDTVTMSDGATTKEQVIPDLTINLADTEADALSGTTTLPEEGGFLTVEPDWWTDSAHEVVPEPGGSWHTSWTGEWDITGNTGFAIQTDADGDQTGTATPDPRVAVDPQANRIWALDFTMGVQLTLTITGDEGQELYSATGTSLNVLHRGSWVRDMWAQPIGDLERPAVGLWDTGEFDVQANFVVTVTDGTSTVSTQVADLAVDSVDAETDTIIGHSTGDVTFNLSEGGGYWGHHVTPVAGQWSYHFDPDLFPFEGLDPGMVVIAVADGTWTIVRTVVPESFAYDFGGFVKPIAPPPAVNSAKAGQSVRISFSLGGDYGLDIFEAGSPTSVMVTCPAGSPVGTPEATSGTLTYSARKDLYSYEWALPKAWKGTCRQLVIDFDDGSQYVLSFKF